MSDPIFCEECVQVATCEREYNSDACHAMYAYNSNCEDDEDE